MGVEGDWLMGRLAGREGMEVEEWMECIGG